MVVEDVNRQPSNSNLPANPSAVVNALQGLFSTHEARVLGATSLFVGYICVLLTKILNFQNPYVGILAIAVLIVLLLSLNTNVNWRASSTWVRAVVIVIIGLLLTSPQLFFAWTVSVAEARRVAMEGQRQEIRKIENGFVPPKIVLEKTEP